VVTDPESITVLVNKTWRLPPGWQPPDLVPPDVAFVFDGPSPKRLLRTEAAAALEELFAAAEGDGLPLAAVSGFRTEQTQAQLFDAYVARDGEAEASRYSARPGHSEHQTGLAMDVTGRDGACAAEPCFAGTPEAVWLAAHAAEHGFVIRYPEGAEAITGYLHEPWHLRYVGVGVATDLVARGLTLDEYLA
jgi:D-alanyl-D-alanine carboxypeptidase